jgi:hypothetical protein
MSKRNQRLKRERYVILKHTGLSVREFRLREQDNPLCWCGVKNPYYAPIHHECCGGAGYIECFCGGDQCVCHNHGEVECFGCADCDEHDDQEFYDEQDGWND